MAKTPEINTSAAIVSIRLTAPLDDTLFHHLTQ
jgi:hypothetical protein